MSREPVRAPLAAAAAVALAAALAAGGFFRWLLLLAMERPRPLEPEPGLAVAVVTTFVPGAERLDMLEQTVAALVAMDYPHDTWVLDEGGCNEARELCARLGARHFTREGRPEFHSRSGIFETGSKHGNYNAWLYSIGFRDYDVVCGFDPDHVPERHFLTRVLGYFRDPQVGYVQAPQAYYNQQASFIAQGAAEETYNFYSVVQPANYALGCPVVIGSHHTHRVTALQEVGGFAPHAADDLAITYLYRSRGWRGVYVPEVLARGLTPVDWSAYLIQQLRWARSLFDLKFRVLPVVGARWPLKTVLVNLLQGLTYLQDAVVAIAACALLILMLTTGAGQRLFAELHATPLALAVAGLFASDLYLRRYSLFPEANRGLHWRAGVLRLAKWPYTLRALSDVVRNRVFPYSLTRKAGRSAGTTEWFRPHLWLAAVLSASWVVGIAAGRIEVAALHVWAAAAIAAFLALAATERREFPEPYDPALQPQAAPKVQPVPGDIVSSVGAGSSMFPI